MIIRALEPDDMQPLLALFNDGEWQANMSMPYYPMMAHQLFDWIRSWSTPQHIFFVADLRGQAVGFAQLMHVDVFNRHAEGAVVLDRAHRRGIHGAALMKAVHLYAKNTLNLRKIWARVSVRNVEAFKLCRHFKYRQVGVLGDHIYSGGEWHSVTIMELFL